MPTQKAILETLQSHPEGIRLKELSEELGIRETALTKTLSDVKRKGFVGHDAESGVYSVTAEGTAWLKAQPAAASGDGLKPGQLPSEFDTFLEIGRSTGVTGELLTAIAEHVFRLNYKDPTIVFNELTSLALRADTVARWSRLWASHLGVPAPTQAASAANPSAPAATAPRRFSVIAGNVVRDDESGEFTLTEALRVVEARQAPAESEELKTLRLELANARDLLQQQRFDQLKAEIGAQLTELKQEMAGLFGKIDHAQGLSELDVIARIADKSFAELGNLRGDLKNVLSVSLPFPPKTPQQRADQKTQFREALTQDKVLEALEANIWGDVPLPPWYTQMQGKRAAEEAAEKPPETAAPRLLE